MVASPTAPSLGGGLVATRQSCDDELPWSLHRLAWALPPSAARPRLLVAGWELGRTEPVALFALPGVSPSASACPSSFALVPLGDAPRPARSDAAQRLMLYQDAAAAIVPHILADEAVAACFSQRSFGCSMAAGPELVLALSSGRVVRLAGASVTVERVLPAAPSSLTLLYSRFLLCLCADLSATAFLLHPQTLLGGAFSTGIRAAVALTSIAGSSECALLLPADADSGSAGDSAGHDVQADVIGDGPLAGCQVIWLPGALEGLAPAGTASGAVVGVAAALAARVAAAEAELVAASARLSSKEAQITEASRILADCAATGRSMPLQCTALEGVFQPDSWRVSAVLELPGSETMQDPALGATSYSQLALAVLSASRQACVCSCSALRPACYGGRVVLSLTIPAADLAAFPDEPLSVVVTGSQRREEEEVAFSQLLGSLTPLWAVTQTAPESVSAPPHEQEWLIVGDARGDAPRALAAKLMLTGHSLASGDDLWLTLQPGTMAGLSGSLSFSHSGATLRLRCVATHVPAMRAAIAAALPAGCTLALHDASEEALYELEALLGALTAEVDALSRGGDAVSRGGADRSADTDAACARVAMRCQ